MNKWKEAVQSCWDASLEKERDQENTRNKRY